MHKLRYWYLYWGRVCLRRHPGVCAKLLRMRLRTGWIQVSWLASVWLAGAAVPAWAEQTGAAADPIAQLIAAYERAVPPGAQADSYRDLMRRVMLRVQRSYPVEVDLAALAAAGVRAIEAPGAEPGEPAAVFKRSLNAALATLDPHSSVLDENDYARFGSSQSGSFSGLGLEIEMAEGLVRVIAPIEDTPAARAGLRSGDLIVKFDDQPVLGLTQADAVARMRGQPGTPITLLIRRPGHAAEFSVLLVRDLVRSQLLTWRIEEDVLVLRLRQFAGSLKPLIDQAVAQATATQQLRGVILDLRGNPGGLVNQAVAVADAFLGQGEIVSMRGRWPGNSRSWSADDAQHLPTVPMVVLIDGGSASASELVAGALQDNARATVMGQRSFGKGSVQTLLPLGTGAGALRLTTALYATPSGRLVQRTGIGPDIELVAPQNAPPRFGRREQDRAQALPGAQEPLPPKARIEQERCPRPPQGEDRALGCAIAFLKAGALDRFVATLDPARPQTP